MVVFVDNQMLSRWLIFFFNDTATTEIYTLSLHDALPILRITASGRVPVWGPGRGDSRPRCVRRVAESDVAGGQRWTPRVDRKSTRLNSSHANISYAVFCLKKKKKTNYNTLIHIIDHRRTE